MSDIKISGIAKNAAEKILGPAKHLERHDKIIQLAINEACKPLVEALEELCNRVDAWDKAVEDIIGRRSNANMSTVEARAALADYRKEHGP